MGLWMPALLAAEVHFAEHLEPSRMVDLMRRERMSVLIAVPRVLQLLRVHLLGRFAVAGGGDGGARGFGVGSGGGVSAGASGAGMEVLGGDLGWGTLPSELEDSGTGWGSR